MSDVGLRALERECTRLDGLVCGDILNGTGHVRHRSVGTGRNELKCLGEMERRFDCLRNEN